VKNFKYTEPVMVTLIFICLILHCLGYNSTVDSILLSLCSAYFGLDIYLRKKG